MEWDVCRVSVHEKKQVKKGKEYRFKQKVIYLKSDFDVKDGEEVIILTKDLFKYIIENLATNKRDSALQAYINTICSQAHIDLDPDIFL